LLDLALTSLRSSASEDREFLWSLHRETMRDYVAKTWGWDDNWQREHFDEKFDPEGLQIIEYGDQPIGYISVRRPGTEIFIAAIEIAPAFQNRGVGTRLISNLLNEADWLRIPVKLLVLKVNPARRLYERLGFQCTGETNTHFAMKREPRSLEQ
jgi:ribosomal protein S18 acetylase RimI-like enzyme